jgi:hypothetical protein
MSKCVIAIILLMVIIIPVAADVSPATWSWNTYPGTVTWQVTVIEDQTGCQGPVLTNTYTVPIQFRGNSAVMGDVGHGSAGGTFTSGNVLHIPSRSVADPPGESTLSPYDVFFTTDCSAFAAQYSWDYSGSDGSCSGTTKLNGANSNGCPAAAISTDTTAPSVATTPEEYFVSQVSIPHSQFLDILPLFDQRDQLGNMIGSFQFKSDLNHQNTGKYLQEPPDITQARADLKQVQDQIAAKSADIEKEYQEVLVKDPTNIQANWDLAQLKKSGNQMDAAIIYAQNALKNPDSDKYESAIEKSIADGANLRVYPSPDNSNFVATVKNQLPAASQNVFGTNVQSQPVERGFLTNLFDFEVYASAKTALLKNNLVNQATYGR